MRKSLAEFQKECVDKLNQYSSASISALIGEDILAIDKIAQIYRLCLPSLTDVLDFENDTKCIARNIFQWAKEGLTSYKISDIANGKYKKKNNKLHEAIYSPRMDLLMAPVFQVNGRSFILGNSPSNIDVGFFKLLSEIAFVRDLIEGFECFSKRNFEEFFGECLDASSFTNKKPWALFGIEIERQNCVKYLMGDFVNVASLSYFPILLVPERNLKKVMDMLKYQIMIQEKKQVNFFSVFSGVRVLSIQQFVAFLNEKFKDYDIAPLQYYDD